ncbi:MAG: hypothetical protein KA015_00780 [Spirochaetes bacterium]|nr:hypothetical protein [Spirochaetota bacterium]
MKRFLSIILLILPVFIYSSRVSLSPEVSYISTGDSLSPVMFGMSLETDVMKNLSFGYRFGKGVKTKNADKVNEEKIDFMVNIFYAQYRYPVYNIPLFGFGEIGAGYSAAKVTALWDSADTATSQISDRGTIISLRTGAVYDLTQNVSFIAGFGWHKSIYSGSLDEAGKSITGYQLFFGVKFNVFGFNNEMESRY